MARPIRSQALWEGRHVVVQFYICSGVAVFGTGFDDVGVEGSLGKEFGVFDF